MAKAKKKTSKKKSPSKKGSKNASSNFPLLIIMAILVIGIVFYGINETSLFVGKSHSSISTEASSKSSTTRKSESNQVTKNASKNIHSDNTIKKTEPHHVSTLNGAKESAKTNKNLPVYTKDDNYYYSSSFDFSWPAYDNSDQIVEHAYFTLSYNEKKEQAEWVAYKLTKANLLNAKFKRKDNFRSDPDVKTKSASLRDYKGSGFDRGHLAPAADFTWTEQGLDDSFYMSNMSPQKPNFNRGIWKKLEGKTRKWAKENDALFIVTGPIFKGNDEKIGKNKVAIPDQYFKIILDLSGKEVKGIAFVLDNEGSNKSLANYAMSIDKAERITGFDFFPSIPDKLEKAIEKTYSYELWEH